MIFHLLVAAAMAGLTWTLGWWGVVVASVIVGWAYREENGRAWRVALGAAEGWTVLLILDAVSGPLGRVGATLQGVMSIPAILLIAATILFPALMGWSTAALVSEVSKVFLQRTDIRGAAQSQRHEDDCTGP